MATYTFQGFASRSTYNLVLQNGYYDQVLTGIQIAQTPINWITQGSTNSTRYSIDFDYDSGIEVSLSGFGTHYGIDFAGLGGASSVTGPSYAATDLMTITWAGGSKTSTVLNVAYEWNDLVSKTGHGLSFIVLVDGDALPNYATYNQWANFLASSTLSSTMPTGFGEGVTIPLTNIDGFVSQTEDDSLIGTSGTDNYRLGAGNDYISGEDGRDYLQGEAGNDTILGGNQNDTLFGGSGNDLLQGNADDDLIYADTGNDTVLGGSGADTAFLGDGRDLFQDNDAAGGNDTVQGGKGNDTLIGASGNDNFQGQDGKDLIRGGAHNDVLDGGGGKDRLFGEAGNDSLAGGTFADTLQGGRGTDTLAGGLGNDLLVGGDGFDSLQGGRGNDKLFGGKGRDIIESGLGNDTMTGGLGADEFLIAQIANTDAKVITDYQLGIDDLNFFFATQSNLTAQIVGNDTLLTQKRGGTILIQNETDTSGILDDIFGIV
ncbi:hypothetical protein NBRC116590_12760 [Pelagimonas sp. KU-00592-HH]|uniref:calcium-binding protein n=1 Tax=Pelagimonas sp. KU-00592-HH TaxID=3127651 RepID=UPI00310AB0FA